MSKVLTIENLHVAIDGKEILRGVDLTIRQGEVHALMGPNGSGKSTLSYALMGHPKYEVTEGSVTLDGQDILAMEADERAKAGIFLAFQYPTSIPGVSVANFLRHAVTNVRKPDRKEGEDLIPMRDFRKELREQMDELGVDQEFARRYLNEGFSGGEKKRAEILQLAMLRPAFAILDETDSGLDIDAVRIVSEGVNRVAERHEHRGPGHHPLRADPHLHQAPVRPHPLRRPDRRGRRPRAGQAARERGLRLGPPRSTPTPPGTRTSWRPRRRGKARRSRPPAESATHPPDNRHTPHATRLSAFYGRIIHHGDRSEPPGCGHQGRVQVRVPRLGRELRVQERQGADARDRLPDLGDEERAAVDARLPPQGAGGLPPEADAHLGRRPLRAELRRYPLLHEGGRPPGQELGRRPGRDQEHLRQAGHPRGRAEVPGRRRRPVRVGGRLPQPARGPAEEGGHLRRHRHGGARAPRPGARVLRQDHPDRGQQVRRAELGGLERRVVRVHPGRGEGRHPACRPISGSTPRTWASSSGR